MNKRIKRIIQKTYVFLTLGAFLIAANPVAAKTRKSPRAQSTSVDLVTILKIKCHKSAGGLDGAGLAGFAALGAAVAGIATGVMAGSTVVGTGGVAIGAVAVTPLAIAKASAAGASTAMAAAKFLDSTFSGQDDLIVWVDGKKVIPTSGKFQPMNAGQSISPNVTASIKGTGIISLFEYDSGSDNDPLGSLVVNGGKDDLIQDAIVLAPREKDGSIYYVTYKIEAGKGNPADVVTTILCGTADSGCGLNQTDLDRDKDVSDLVPCPDRFREAGLVKYPQIWPAADVYLRRCTRIDPAAGIAVGKPATMSSTYESEEAPWAAKAVDGNIDGDFRSASVTHTVTSANPWWQVDLQKDYQVSAIRIWNRTDCCGERLANFVVSVGDGINWKRIPFPGVAGRTTTIPVNARGRYVKVELIGTGTLSLAEVEVFGNTNFNTQPPPQATPRGKYCIYRLWLHLQNKIGTRHAMCSAKRICWRGWNIDMDRRWC